MRPHLRSFEAAWIDAAFAAIYPDQGDAKEIRSHLPHGIAQMHPAQFFDDILAKVPFEQSLGLRVTLWLIALAPLFTIRRLGTIASIGPADRTRVLERLVTSPNYVIRQLAMSFKAIATLLYVQSASIRAAMTLPNGTNGTPGTHGTRSRLDGPGGDGDLISASRLTARLSSTSTSTTSAGDDHEHAAE